MDSHQIVANRLKGQQRRVSRSINLNSYQLKGKYRKNLFNSRYITHTDLGGGKYLLSFTANTINPDDEASFRIRQNFGNAASFSASPDSDLHRTALTSTIREEKLQTFEMEMDAKGNLTFIGIPDDHKATIFQLLKDTIDSN
ncbi:MAG TPA: hypothetical protein V6C96_02280 [Vampirovibrionales bacterium]